MQNFLGKPLFQAMYNNTTENSETNLSCVSLMLGGWREDSFMILHRLLLAQKVKETLLSFALHVKTPKRFALEDFLL